MGIFDIFKKKPAGGSEVVFETDSASTPETVASTSVEINEPAVVEIDEYQQALDSGLERSRKGIWDKLSRALVGKSRIDDAFLDELEGILVQSDVGIETTLKIIERIEKRVAKDKYTSATELNALLREEIVSLLVGGNGDIDGFSFEKDADGNPFVVMVVGVNGVGKTTTIGKIASRLQSAGRNVYIGAADTFRAAAIDQLEVWANRAGAKIVKQNMGSDPASVAFDAISSAKAAGADVVLIDTAGRLHNKIGLMNELSKIRNVMQKVVPNAPHEVLLVLDGSTGQNAYEQAKQFSAATNVTALAITKLDGTAKGGVVIGISDMMQIPVRFIGVGERVEDLQIFEPQTFVETIFKS